MDDDASAFAPTTGLPALDAVLRGVQRGDNVVWQIQSLDEYLALVQPYARAARAQRRRLIYFRFASHAPLLAAGEGAEIHHPRPQDGFDAFVDQVHSVIEAAGRETMYVFDCLSELAGAWQSDRMMGNFFRLTCPRLFDLDTVTYFGVYRNTHAGDGMDTIADTTQYLLDVFRCRGRLYIRPIKVQHRSARAMNLIHAWEDGDRFRAVADSGTVSEILAGSGWAGLEGGAIAGHWDRHFAAARGLLARRRADADGGQAAREADCFARLARLLFPEGGGLLRLIGRYMGLEDLLAIRARMIGNGSIGGKAAGMLLARAILRRDLPALHERLEAHDSFYVGTEVFDTFFVLNRLWWIRRRQREPESFLQGLDEARGRILQGEFPEPIVRRFEAMLDYFGEWPFIVRSSSRLEDRYGSAFAGQYDSVFCVNQGPRGKRLADLLDAVRQVYASTLGEQALRYRQRRGLLHEHEQMALLIMRVSGTAGRRYFHPHAAGVGLSVNPYPWNPQIDMRAGVVRLVAGLGTRAVDRSDDDYTRLIALNAPALRPETNFGAIARHAQRRMDALDLQQNRLVSGPFAELVKGAGDFPLALFTSRERDDGPAFLTFDGLVSRTAFVDDLRALLAVLHAAYDHPVEVEFAVNFGGDAYRINLLQCRPMQIRDSEGAGDARPPEGARQVVAARGAVIGPGRVIHPERIVLVRPAVYGQLGQADRLAVTQLVGRINQASAGRCLLVLGPGRWGSRDLWLGLPVAFAEINHVAALCEIVAMHDNLVPDVSLGTHFLNELIEADMLYFALFPRLAGNHLDEEALQRLPNRLADLLPDAARWSGVLHVADVARGAATLYADAERQQAVLTLAG
ncbi:PEP/pyruvate-binding domain-containing protein [Thauera sinica]|uniref:PEP/pyruvate-binding domain-containing protein n=1 Tax=Thauera sinica TaxID=2665146 RepID=A0ABW1AQN3_9RHOO|nr:PEP/pyruvate-binding domain-containing protein [Thauera sp. K11]ATE59785.1 pyruvate, phosphate dikinase [Thauera sp. K11]